MAERDTADNAIGAAPAPTVAGAESDAAAMGANRLLAWNRGDFALVPKVDDPAVETRLTVGGQVAAGLDDVYYGPEGHCRVMALWNEVWPKWDAEIDKIIEEGRDRVVIVARVHGEAAATGIRMDAWSAARYTFREGLILRVEGTLDPDRAKALEALGPSG